MRFDHVFPWFQQTKWHESTILNSSTTVSRCVFGVSTGLARRLQRRGRRGTRRKRCPWRRLEGPSGDGTPRPSETRLGKWRTGWWFSHPSEKYESQLGWLFPIYGKIKNVPNHQPENRWKWINMVDICWHRLLIVIDLWCPSLALLSWQIQWIKQIHANSQVYASRVNATCWVRERLPNPDVHQFLSFSIAFQ